LIVAVIYVDDVPLIRGYATALWDLPDIQRIEVLRGPQGTLYGQNSTAGAVKIVSIEPGSDREAWVSAGIGNYDALEFRGYVNEPIGTEGTAASFAFSRRTNDGFAYNASLNEGANKLDATQFRAKLKWNMGGAISMPCIETRPRLSSCGFMKSVNSVSRKAINGFRALLVWQRTCK
jgi:iron complex outermembrane receptor protein